MPKPVALAEVAEYSVLFMQLMHHCPIMFDPLTILKVYGQGISRYVQVFQTRHFPRPKESMNSAVCSQPLGRHSRFLGQKGDKGVRARFHMFAWQRTLFPPERSLGVLRQSSLCRFGTDNPLYSRDSKALVAAFRCEDRTDAECKFYVAISRAT